MDGRKTATILSPFGQKNLAHRVRLQDSMGQFTRQDVDVLYGSLRDAIPPMKARRYRWVILNNDSARAL